MKRASSFVSELSLRSSLRVSSFVSELSLRSSLRTRFFSVVVMLGGWVVSSCAPSGFPSASAVASVRILAAAAEPPYVKPGATVTVSMLADDARPTKLVPMTLHWLPLVCTNPPNGAYYGCFQQFAGGGQGTTDAGAPAGMTLAKACAGAVSVPVGSGGVLQPGVDLTQYLPSGDCVEFTMPADVVYPNGSSSAAAPPSCMDDSQCTTSSAGPFCDRRRGCSQVPPYGLAILFNIACAGRVELVPLDPNNVQAPPIGCFDANHNRLGPSDYVIGFTRVYGYETIQNANPAIDSVDVEGQKVDMATGFETLHCEAGSRCAPVHIGPIVPPSSWEPDPVVRDANQKPLHEQIWAEFFSTLGSFNQEVRLLYDARTGSVGGPSDTDTEFQPPNQPGDGTIWIVVHDNRGGASWAVVPVKVL
jgi:hypothetical protein